MAQATGNSMRLLGADPDKPQSILDREGAEELKCACTARCNVVCGVAHREAAVCCVCRPACLADCMRRGARITWVCTHAHAHACVHAYARMYACVHVCVMRLHARPPHSPALGRGPPPSPSRILSSRSSVHASPGRGAAAAAWRAARRRACTACKVSSYCQRCGCHWRECK